MNHWVGPAPLAAKPQSTANASKTSTQAELFVAPASRDYRLRAGAVAANAGVASFNGKNAPAEDIARVIRPQGDAWDHGAYESF